MFHRSNPMLRHLVLSSMAVTAFAGCGRVDPSDPDALSQAIIIPGATRVQGSPPSEQAGSSGPAPQVSGGGTVSATSGQQAVLSLSYTSASGYDNCYVQVEGASDYFELPLDNPATEGQVQIPIEFPTAVGTGFANFYTCIQGADGGVSNPWTTGFDIYNPEGGGGSGVGQCTDAEFTEGCGTLRTCVEVSPFGVGACWYEAGGRRFDCAANCDCLAAAQAAVDFCSP